MLTAATVSQGQEPRLRTTDLSGTLAAAHAARVRLFVHYEEGSVASAMLPSEQLCLSY